MDHPTLAELIERSEEPDILAHISGCPPCRARARVFDGLANVERDALPGFDDAEMALGRARKQGATSLSHSLFGRVEDATRPEDLPVGRLVERYTVQALVGRGGMGTVYRVQHNRLGSLHALKVLHRTSPQVRQRLVREGRAQGSLRHPNVVPVTDIVDVDGAPGLIMEFIDGPTLAEHLLDAGPLPVDEADRLAEQILRGVMAAHATGIVHRDLKPSNVLLAPTDEGFVAKVCDFGLARQVDIALDDTQLTRPRTPMGTPAYMAPEQIRDASRADPRSDVFALGALLYEMVTGHRAFEGDDLLDTYDRVRAAAYQPVKEHVPTAPGRIVGAIDGALRVDPDTRLPDCRSLLEAWRGERRVPRLRRRWSRPPLAAAGLVVAGALSGAVALTLFPGGDEQPASAHSLLPPRTPALRERRLTALPDELQVYSASMSPDGTAVAFSDGRGVWLQPVDGGSLRQLVDGGDVQNVHFFPDGDRVLVSGRRDGEEGTWAVYVDGRGEKLLFEEACLWMRVSPDGQRIAMADSNGLWVLSIDGKNRTRLRPLAAGDGTSGLEWSPTGAWLVAAHHSTTGEPAWLEITAADGSSTRRLVEDPRLLALTLAPMAWLAPDTLLFTRTSYDDEIPSVSVFALDGAEEATDATGARHVHSWSGFSVVRLRASADGRRVATSRVVTDSAVRLLSLGEEVAPRRLSDEGWSELPLGWLGDGRVLVRSNRGGGGLYAYPLDGGEPERLATGGRIVNWAGQAGAHLVFQRAGYGDKDGTTQLQALRVPLAGGAEQSFRDVEVRRGQAVGLEARYHLRCREAVRCLASRPDSNDTVLQYIDVATGAESEPVAVFPGTAHRVAWDLSPDGERVALVTSNPARLVVVELANGRSVERTLKLNMFLARHLAWSVDGQRLFATALVDDARQPYQVVAIDTDGEVETLYASMTSFFPAVHPSPDGRHLAVGMHTFDDDLWLLDEAAWGVGSD